MIGIVASADDLPLIEEFFQLFKTPWQPAVPSQHYRVVIATDPSRAIASADLLLIYGSDACSSRGNGKVEPSQGPTEVDWNGCTLPVYGAVALVGTSGSPFTLRASGEPIAQRSATSTGVVWHIGYDLFQEVKHLLTFGQPSSHAATPTLELHVDILRWLLITAGASFVEIPPRPHGYRFTCCLTHDIDFFGIRREALHHRTLVGFVARASVGTLLGVVRRARTWSEAARNWSALLSLPLVLLRLRPDFWQPFDDYAAADEAHPSTFFLIPFKGRPGIAPDGRVNRTRAVSYEISEIHEEIRAASTQRAELAVHGIDAWRDHVAGREELAQLTAVIGGAAGVRMHWLYFDRDSAARLDAAGFAYDSTWGYNDAIGYRAGTSQVFRFPGTRQLLELPMAIMDTALFYAERMGLRFDQAEAACRALVQNAIRWGGTVVINWHCRSLAPERLWGRFYDGLLHRVGQEGAWFASAGAAVDWYRWRRSIEFSTNDGRTVVRAPTRGPGPPAVVCVQRPATNGGCHELPFDGQHEIAVTL